MIHPIWIIAFVGHRPGSGPGRSQSEIAACRPRIEEALKLLVLKAKKAGGSIELLTSVAAGADIETAEVARGLGIPVHLILPKSVEDFRHDFDGDLESYWPRAQELIDTAISPDSDGSFRFSKGSKTSPECYHDTNIQMIRSADVAVAVWNGEPASGLGGTQEFVEEAVRMEMPVAVVDPSQNAEVDYKGDWANWPQSDPVIDKLNKVVFKPAKNKAASSTKDESVSSRVLLFTKLDESAIHFGNKFRGRLKTSVLLHFIAGLLAAITASWSPYFHEKDHQLAHVHDTKPRAVGNQEQGKAEQPTTSGHHPEKTGGHSEKSHVTHSKEPHTFWHCLPIGLTFFELFLVSVACYFLLQSHRSHDHHKWRRSRFAAELLRSSEPSASHLDPLLPLVSHHEPSWHRFAISTGLVSHHQAREIVSFEEQKEAYLRNRVCDQRDRYFRKMHPLANRWNWFLSKLGFSMAVAAPVLILVAFLLKLLLPDWSHSGGISPFFVKFLPIFLPLAAGVATSLLVATDVGRRAERYQNLGERLDQIARIMPGIKTQASVDAIVSETEEILLDELIEWYSASQSTGH